MICRQRALHLRATKLHRSVRQALGGGKDPPRRIHSGPAHGELLLREPNYPCHPQNCQKSRSIIAQK